jgi:hypothetical protein
MLEEDVLSMLAKGDADASLVNHYILSLGGAGIVTPGWPSGSVYHQARNSAFIDACRLQRIVFL